MCSWAFLCHRSEEFQSSNYFDINVRYFCLEVDSDVSLLSVKHIFNCIIIAFSLTEFQHFGTEALRKVDLQTKSLKSLPFLASIFITFGAS